MAVPMQSHPPMRVLPSSLKPVFDVFKTQLCTVAISVSLFNSTRLPREALRHGAVPYLVVYSFWLLVTCLPTTLLQLAIGQLSQQDPVGVWRAVPILRGVGHLRILTSYICCVYNMTTVALSLAYLIWIAKGAFPLKDCTKLHLTPYGYENKMNASECFNSTFLAPFTEYPQYLGIMAILIFVLWFFLPILLYRLRKSLKVSLSVLTPIVIIVAIVLCIFLADADALTSQLVSCEQWTQLSQPYIWHSTLVQALLSTQIVGGYLISAGGTVYRHSDVRWIATSTIITNLVTSWLWVFMWNSIGGVEQKDTSFIAILVLIYQSSTSENRAKEWPLLAFGIVFITGIISVLTLLFPIYDKLHRQFGDHWRLFATASSAIGTAVTVAILSRGIEVVTILDELIVPVLAVFTAAVEIVGFVFIYGWYYLLVDIEFLTGTKLPCIWIVAWWTTPVLAFGITGWWLRALLRASMSQSETLWPLLGVFIFIIVIMVIAAAVAVAKEEQFNLLTKITSSFRPSRLWGPEEPLARYVWMSQRYANDALSTNNDGNSDALNYSQIVFKKDNEKKINEDWLHNDKYQRNNSFLNKTGNLDTNVIFKDVATVYGSHAIPRSKRKKKPEEKFRSPNICIAKPELNGQVDCNCNRHFTLNVPNLRNNEVTTSL